MVVFAGKGENVEKFGKLGTTSNRQQDSTDPPGNARFEIKTHPRRLTRFYASVDTQVCISEGSSEHSGLSSQLFAGDPQSRQAVPIDRTASSSIAPITEG